LQKERKIDFRFKDSYSWGSFGQEPGKSMGTIGFSGHDERPRPTGEDERILKRLARLMGRCPKQTSQRLNLAAKDALKTHTGGDTSGRTAAGV
jgi:hypothetical protein